MSRTSTADESAQRAAEVDASAPKNASSGVQNRPGRSEDEALAEIERKHGVRADDHQSERRHERAAGKPPKAKADKRFDPNAPLTWSKEEREKGQAIRDDEGKFRTWLDGSSDAVRGAATREADEKEQLPPKVAARERARAEEQDTEQRGAKASRGSTTSGAEPEDRMTVALQALRRDGWTQAELDRLDDDALLRMGERRARGQEEIDRKLAERSQTIQREARDRSAEPSGSPPEPAAGHTDATLDAVFSDLETALSEGFVDEELGKKVSASLRALVEARSSQRADPVSDTRNAIVNELIEERMKQRLGERFPEVSDDDALWRTVAQKAQFLYEAGVPRGQYQGNLQGIEQAFGDAARIAGLRQETDADRAEREHVSRARRNGTVSREASRDPGQFSGMSTDDLESAWLMARERNDQAEMNEVQKLLNSARRRRPD